ncbi:MAG: peptide chain release factor N(5)-glutamine methyltransferase [Buchnera aphidicola (Pentalonia nigronervosa)]|jgi:release factor glutamine methyltransferase|uniref:Release factor glutamine methyltransferase n=1 Tax=Buchnera aphidicola (Pentalonia nigronervosa) TaxID=1309793 RepID=A0A7H1AZJ2_9GAMM|nr:MAG: peptide chain release factor N(5)-glutamine methyltransferase [Buchnera aphidicola (Pentalonia nigronervosa)]
MNIQRWLKKTINKLPHVDNPKFEAEFLLGYVTRCTRSYILTADSIQLNLMELKYLDYLVHRRSLGEPIAYIIGKKEFWSLSLIVSYDTLIPRPDTEILVEQASLKINKKFSVVLDLGTGCGAVALALGSMHTDCNIIGIDKSIKALEIAKLNALQLNLKHVSFFYSDWFSHVDQKFDIIVSNPPYVGKHEMKLLKQDIFFEPLSAIISENDGFLDIERIIKMSSNYLFLGGWLLIEHGYQQRLQVQFFFRKYNFSEIASYKDYGGNDRVTIGRKIHN